MRLFVFLIVLFFSINLVQAIMFVEDSEFSQGNINYIFKSGVAVDNLDISENGIELNDGNEKINVSILGGKLTITFYKFNNSKNISFKSSVPQNIKFNIESNNINQYLYDGKSHYIDNYYIENDEIFFSYKTFDLNNNKEQLLTVNKVEKEYWLNHKIVEYEILKSKDTRGLISSKTVAITYLQIILISIAILILVILWAIIKK